MQSFMSFTLVTTAEGLNQACSRLSQDDVVGIDTETTALDPFLGRLRLIQLAGRSGTFVVDLDRFGGARHDSPSLEPLRKLLSSTHPLKIAHNSKFDLKWIKHRLGVDVGSVFDTMLAAQLLDFDGRHSLKAIADQYLKTDIDKSLQSSDWSRVLSHAQLEYAAQDAQILLPLRRVLDELIKREGLEQVAALEFETVHEVAKLELGGIAIDRERFESLIAAIESRRDTLGDELRALLQPGVPQMSLFSDALSNLNLDSPLQLSEAFERIGIGLPQSTRARYLIPLAEEHDAVMLLLNYREMHKLSSSFGRNILRVINRTTGRLHAHYRQIGTVTGRITCEKPNLQQMPKEGEVRGVFRAPEGRVMITADYSTFELRVLAEASGDRAMIEAFLHGRDLHRETAAMVFKCAPEAVTTPMRQVGKHLNLGVVYGLGARGLGRKTGQTEEEAQHTLQRFFRSHPELKSWIDSMEREAVESNKVRTLSGRLIRFHYDPEDRDVTAYVKRLARNAPAQGTAADILKRALVILGKRLPAKNAQVVNIIHDEVLVEAPSGDAEEVASLVSAAMTEAGREFLPNVPVEVKPSIAPDWRKD
jgi:DNA polymerase I-like protein with 3'-5' exonuclease and polymerase domains